MRVLVLNCGSSTLKFQLIETSDSGATERKLARGIVDRIGGPASYHFETNGTSVDEKALAVANHEEAARLVIDWLRSKPGLESIDAVGHRVVHGGERFTASVLIDDNVIATLEALCEIAPLHNPGAVSRHSCGTKNSRCCYAHGRGVRHIVSSHDSRSRPQPTRSPTNSH